ncbi:MAG: hypothetical protein AAGA54_26405 [Myxococcota bacterium]
MRKLVLMASVIGAAACSDDGTVGADTDAPATASGGVTDGFGSSGAGEVDGGSEDPSVGDDSTGGGSSDSDPTDAGGSTGPGGGSGGDGGSTGGVPPMREGVYVSIAEGADSNAGTREEPVRTLGQGIALAVELELGWVYVAAGYYSVNSDDNAALDLVGGVSMRGGFSASDWDDWDPATHVARVVDTATMAAGFSQANPHRAVLVPDGVAGNTTFEGFTVEAAPIANAAAVVLQGDATLRGNILLGSGQAFSTAAFFEDSGALLLENEIDGVASAPGQPAFAVRAVGGAPQVHGNRIRSGEGTNNRAVLLTDAAGVVSSNVIVAEAGEGGAGRVIEMTGSSTAIIGNTSVLDGAPGGFHVIAAGTAAPANLDNNNFISLSETAWCFNGVGGIDAGTVRNNNLGCSNLYSAGIPYGSIAELESALADAADNIAEPSGVTDPLVDGHLEGDGSTLCAVARGGLAFEDDVVLGTDIDAEPRTEPWSIGADEFDGDCL